ncbi:MAG: rod shape-determining protein [Clostridia bacterium]|nr:rod shape-determining protein [Clostridia bacterium]
MAKVSPIAFFRSLIEKIRRAWRRRCVAIDMGASTVRVYLEDRGVIVDEPCVVALDRAADRIVAVGKEAYDLIGRTPADTVILRPTKEGSLTHYEVTRKLLQYYIRTATKSLLRPPRLIISLPEDADEQDEQMLLNAAREAGAGKVYFMESALACAYGTGRDLSRPVGRMVVDIGGGCTTAAVISMGGVVVCKTIRIGGDALDASIVAYVRDRYGVIIGERAGETIKKRIGALYLHRMVRSVEIKGRNAETGLPEKAIITSKEMIEAMAEPAAAIMDVIGDVLSATPEALLSDVMRDGMMLCGGGSLVYGFGRLIAKITGVPVRTLKDPAYTCVCGAARALQMHKTIELTPGMIHLAKQQKRRNGDPEPEEELPEE